MPITKYENIDTHLFGVMCHCHVLTGINNFKRLMLRSVQYIKSVI